MEGRQGRRILREAELGFALPTYEEAQAAVTSGEQMIRDSQIARRGKLSRTDSQMQDTIVGEADEFKVLDRMPTVEELREARKGEEDPIITQERLRQEAPLLSGLELRSLPLRQYPHAQE